LVVVQVEEARQARQITQLVGDLGEAVVSEIQRVQRGEGADAGGHFGERVLRQQQDFRCGMLPHLFGYVAEPAAPVVEYASLVQGHSNCLTQPSLSSDRR
jgi:hypothetical protein